MSRATHHSSRAAAVAAVMALVLAGCGDSPTTPSSTTLTLSCPASTSAIATTTAGAAVNFQQPAFSGGQAPVTVSCAPASGLVFPRGQPQGACTARARAGAIAACAFDVRVSAPPRISQTRFLAFGDSITAGEVTAPMANATGWAPLIVVPASSYPTLLGERLRAAYPLQTTSVVNAGQPGQAAASALSRFTGEMIRVQPEVVLLVMGYNDVGSSGGVSAAANALDAMVIDARARGARVFLGTLTPTITGRQRSMDEALLNTMNVRIRAIAANRGAVLVDLFEGFQPAIFTWVGVDGLHPTEAGYVRIAELFLTAIRATLEVAPTLTALTGFSR